MIFKFFSTNFLLIAWEMSFWTIIIWIKIFIQEDFSVAMVPAFSYMIHTLCVSKQLHLLQPCSLYDSTSISSVLSIFYIIYRSLLRCLLALRLDCFTLFHMHVWKCIIYAIRCKVSWILLPPVPILLALCTLSASLAEDDKLH